MVGRASPSHGRQRHESLHPPERRRARVLERPHTRVPAADRRRGPLRASAYPKVGGARRFIGGPKPCSWRFDPSMGVFQARANGGYVEAPSVVRSRGPGSSSGAGRPVVGSVTHQMVRWSETGPQRRGTPPPGRSRSYRLHVPPEDGGPGERGADSPPDFARAPRALPAQARVTGRPASPQRLGRIRGRSRRALPPRVDRGQW